MASLLAATSLLVSLLVSVANTIATASSLQAASSDIATTAQEMQRARYFTFVMLIRMVQDKIPHNTTFLMPNDRFMSTASIPQSQVLEFLSRHSISAPLMFDDLIRLPNGTVVPTHHSSEMITITNSCRHQKLYFNDVELTSPDLCHLEASFRCHGISGVIRPTATRRGKGVACSRYVAPTSAPPETPSAANQSLGTSSPPSPGYASIPAQQPSAESPQSSDSSIAQIGMTCTTLMTVLVFSIF